MSTLLLTPLDSTNLVDLSGGSIFRKQILPIGSIQYKGRRLDFTRDYLSGLVQAFRDRAYDQVSFILADGQNQHNMDPQNWRGEVRGFELTDTGLDAVLELTPDAAQLVRNNPRMGVSAQIVEGYERADGKQYPQAIRHVLGTLDPRVPGMGPWQAVSLSGSAETELVDLTAYTFEGGADMAQDTELEPQVDEIEDLEQDGAEDDATPEEIPQEASDDASDDAELDLSDWTDEQLTEFLASLDDEDGDGAPAQEQLAGASLSADEIETINLATAGMDELRQHVAGLQAEVAKSRFDAERQRYLTAGVPPHLVDLAAPVLSSPEASVIELSNGDRVDPAQVLRSVLDGCAGYVDLAGEIGTSTTPETDSDPDQGLLDAWDAEYPS